MIGDQGKPNESVYRTADPEQPRLETLEAMNSQIHALRRRLRNIIILCMALACLLIVAYYPTLKHLCSHGTQEGTVESNVTSHNITITTNFRQYLARVETSNGHSSQLTRWYGLECIGYCSIGWRGIVDCSSYQSFYCYLTPPPSPQTTNCR